MYRTRLDARELGTGTAAALPCRPLDLALPGNRSSGRQVRTLDARRTLRTAILPAASEVVAALLVHRVDGLGLSFPRQLALIARSL
jgi:hypothetical protein